MVLQETQFVSKKQIMGWLLLYLERPVLLWVKNFQQCCSRITMEVGMGDFVYLVAEGTVSSHPSVSTVETRTEVSPGQGAPPSAKPAQYSRVRWQRMFDGDLVVLLRPSRHLVIFAGMVGSMRGLKTEQLRSCQHQVDHKAV